MPCCRSDLTGQPVFADDLLAPGPRLDRRRRIGQQFLAVRRYALLIPPQRNIIVQHHVGILQAAPRETVDLLSGIVERFRHAHDYVKDLGRGGESFLRQ